MQIIERHDEIIAESIATFVRMWLTQTKELLGSEREAAILQARHRYERYLRVVGAAVGEGKGFLAGLPKEVILTMADFYDGKTGAKEKG